MIYQPEHASKALEIVESLLPLVTPCAEYDELVEVLRNPSRWHEAHELFYKIRENITLPSDRKKISDFNSLFINVAENAAKTTYNCSGVLPPYSSERPAPFDDESFDLLLKWADEFRSAARIS